ncbi:MAG: histidine phosphatase family protein [Bacteroidetes bacterium]|nr:histidine phosphatase family protein [Bacteroidota bacterium]
MKTLYIVRHAKSSWSDRSLSDHERLLMRKGIVKTKKITDFLSKQIKCPDLLLSSTAVRAKKTADLVAKELDYPEDRIVTSKALYHADSEEIFDEIYGISNNINNLMIFGHNPGLTYFVNLFLRPTIENLPTSGVVSIEFITDKWEEISEAKFHVNFVVFPKMLK